MAKLSWMISLRGTATYSGAAIGTGIKLGSNGIQSMPDRLAAESSYAIKRRLPETDFPQVILLCDNMANALFVRIPGIRVAGIASRDPATAVLPQLNIPAVGDLGEQLDRAVDGDLVIVDGTRGVVYLEPDAQTVQRYSRMLDGQRKEQRFFLGAEHVPARTMDGRVVSVAVLIESGDSVGPAVREGADAIIVGSVADVDEPSAVLSECAGKPVVLVKDEPDDSMLWAAVWKSAPRQVSFALSSEGFSDHRLRLEAGIAAVWEAGSEEALEPSEVVIGIAAQSPTPLPEGAEFLLVWPEIQNLHKIAQDWTGENLPERTTLVIGHELQAARIPVEVGVSSIAVALGSVSEAKDLIRSLPPDYIA